MIFMGFFVFCEARYTMRTMLGLLVFSVLSVACLPADDRAFCL